MSTLSAAAERTHASRCLDCGKCTPSCPVAIRQPGFSPRRLIASVLHEDGKTMLRDCLACGRCEVRCPSAVQFTDFVREARATLPTLNGCPVAHGGLFTGATDAARYVDRRAWIQPDMRVREEGPTMLFVGCAPLFDAYFSYLGVRTLAAASAAVRLMNALGEEPVVRADERCCGHDRLWSGDVEGFRRTAAENVAMIAEAGVKTVVTACAECARCLALDYPEQLGAVPFEVTHMTRWLADRLGENGPALRPREGRVTFQDPCRLGRHLNETRAPREVLAQVPGLELTEMPHAGRDAVCCGTEGFARCGAVSKSIQSDRLAEAAATGADTLLTACPKCMVHLTCAQRDADVDVPLEIRDLLEVVAEALPPAVSSPVATLTAVPALPIGGAL